MLYTQSSSSTDTSTTSLQLLWSSVSTVCCSSFSLCISFSNVPHSSRAAFTSSSSSFHLFSFLAPPRSPSLLCLLVHLHRIHLLLHSSSETQCHCSRQVCISNVICFPVLSFYQAPAVIINNLSPTAASFCVSRLMFPAARWQRCQAQSLWCTERWRS